MMLISLFLFVVLEMCIHLIQKCSILYMVHSACYASSSVNESDN